MAITQTASAFVNATSIGLSRIFDTTASSSNPTYVVLTALDRNEYTVGASGATGSFAGGGRTLGLSSIGGDGRGTGIVFTYQASTGRYYSSIYGYLDQLTYAASSSAGDVTSLSLYGTSSLGLAEEYAYNVYSMMQDNASGYLGSATVVTASSFTGTVPGQATPDSIAAIADGFVGDAWNSNGCWVLASTIAAEAGASLPIQSTAIGVAGQANGEWIVAYNGPAGQAGNWQSLVTAGEIVVIGKGDGSGHITTCVSGSGSTAQLVDNITYLNGQEQITNPAKDGSSDDVIVASPHAASQEWSGVQASDVVIYELDTPIVTASVGSDSIDSGTLQSLGSLFAAADPGGKTIAEWQVYDSSAADSLKLGGVDSQDHSADGALTAASLSAVSLQAGSGAGTDTLEVRAFNGSYWGDWTSLAVAVTAAEPPELETPTAAQTWVAGQAVSLTLAARTFVDPESEHLTYAATLSGGQALPSWLSFNAATETFSGTAPTSDETLSIVVVATDSSGWSASETISASVLELPKLAAVTQSQTWDAGLAVSLALPGTFTDPQGEVLTYKAAPAGGSALPSWLVFNAATQTFSGTAPAGAQTLDIVVTATDTSGLAASEMFAATVIAAPAVSAATPNQVWAEGKPIGLTLAAGTFGDPQGEALTYKAALSGGQALPAWLTFNATTRTFSGTAPATFQALDIVITATNAGGLSASETVAATIAGAPVVAIATPGQTCNAGQAISLALPAGTFTDPQGETLTYKATLSNGQALPNWLTFNAATKTFSGTAPAGAAGFSILVTATDSSGLSVSETIVATIIGAPVVAAATPNQVWVEGKALSVALRAGTFNDPQGEKLTYKAALTGGKALPAWLTFNATTGTFSGTAPATYQALSIVVTAANSSGLAVSETISATVAGTPVVAAATASQTWTAGQKIALALPAGAFTDPQGDKLTYKAALAGGQALPGWLTFNAATDTFSGTAPAGAQTLDIVVTATDSLGLSVSETIAATIIGAPVVAAATPSQAWTEGKAISLALPGGTFTDPQGEKLTYKATLASGQALPSWLTFNAASETFSGTAPGTHQNLSVTVTATNSSGLAVSETISACVAAPPVVAAATGNQTWTEGTKILLALPGGTFSDPQGEKLTYKATLASGQALPSWLTFNAATETFSGTAPASAVTIGITVKATDTSGLSVSESFSAAVQPAATKSVSQPAGGTSAVAAAGDFILQSNVLDGPPMRFLAVETAGGQAGAAAGGTLPFIAPGASGGSISAAELFSIPAAAPWSHPASGSETTFAAATAFDPASVRDLIAFHS